MKSERPLEGFQQGNNLILDFFQQVILLCEQTEEGREKETKELEKKALPHGRIYVL